MSERKIAHIYQKLISGQESAILGPYKARLACLERFESMIRENEQAFLQALSEDLGKPELEGVITETQFVLNEIKHAKKSLKKWMKRKRVSSSFLQFPSRAYIRPEPLGTVLIISPWNYPFQLLLSPLVGAIAGGNTALLKPSEVAIKTSEAMAKFVPKYFKEDEVDVVEGGVAETKELLSLQFQHIFYTGNSMVGRIVMEAASKHLCPVTLELGGKSPCYVDKEVNQELAAKRIIWGKLLNSGQTCVAPDYLLVDAGIAEDFLDKLKEAIVDLYGRDPLNNNDYGKIINKRHFERLLTYLQETRIIWGGESSEELCKIAPTLVEAQPNSLIMNEEIFGPILPIIVVNSFEEGLSLIRRHKDPLAAYLFSQNKVLIERFESEVSAGGMCINDCIVHLTADSLPFGGRGNSGMGAYHGHESFKTFSHYKSIMKRGSIDLPLRYPPFSSFKLKVIKFLLELFG